MRPLTDWEIVSDACVTVLRRRREFRSAIRLNSHFRWTRCSPDADAAGGLVGAQRYRCRRIENLYVGGRPALVHFSHAFCIPFERFVDIGLL